MLCSFSLLPANASEIVQQNKDIAEVTKAIEKDSTSFKLKKSETIKAAKALTKTFNSTFDKLKSFAFGFTIALLIYKGFFAWPKLFEAIHNHPVVSEFVNNLSKGFLTNDFTWGLFRETIKYSPQIIDWAQKVVCVGYNYENPDSWRNWMRNNFCKKA